MDSLDMLLSNPGPRPGLTLSTLARHDSNRGAPLRQTSLSGNGSSYYPMDSLDMLANSSSISGRQPVNTRRQPSNPPSLLGSYSSSPYSSPPYQSPTYSPQSTTNFSSSSSSYVPPSSSYVSSAVEADNSSHRRWGSLQSRQRALDQLSQQQQQQPPSQPQQQQPPSQYIPDPNPAQYKVLQTDSNSSSSVSDGFDPGDKQRQIQLIECPDCHRTFKRQAFLVHQKVCKKVFTKKEKEEPSPAKQQHQLNKKEQKEKWKEESAKLREEMRKAKQQKQGGNTAKTGIDMHALGVF